MKSTRHNGYGFFYTSVIVGFCMLPFVVHFVIMGDKWMDEEGGWWSVFLPLWIMVFIAAFAKGAADDKTPVKDDVLFVLLIILTAISFVGGTIMMMVFNNNVAGLDYGLGSFLVSILIAGVAHSFPAFLLYKTYEFKTGDGYSDKLYYDYSLEEKKMKDDHDEEDNTKDNKGHDFFADYDMTKDYYGKHGEFDKNDDSWGTSEYIRQFHNDNPDLDLSDHFDWQERAEAESDGFLEDD